MTATNNVMAVYEVTMRTATGKAKATTNATSADSAIAFIRNDRGLPPSMEITARLAPITASQLAARHEAWNPETRMFSRENMKFAGDTMGNFYVPVNTVKVRKHTGEVVECWELQRRRATVKGFSSSFYFCAKTYAKVNGDQVHGQEESSEKQAVELPQAGTPPAPKPVTKTGPRQSHILALVAEAEREKIKAGGYWTPRVERLLRKAKEIRQRESYKCV